ncbi:hypothetical protein PWT90_10749 [Aphanocladium album]|nr:hypothetical protein PWT90_10749 [Aphanocladium album]
MNADTGDPSCCTLPRVPLSPSRKVPARLIPWPVLPISQGSSNLLQHSNAIQAHPHHLSPHLNAQPRPLPSLIDLSATPIARPDSFSAPRPPAQLPRARRPAAPARFSPRGQATPHTTRTTHADAALRA